MEINIYEFPEYENYPAQGITYYQDSRVFDLDFDKDEHFHDVKCLISIDYTRYYTPSNQESPEYDDFEVTEVKVEVIKGVMYKGEDEHILGEKELRRIEKYLTENIQFI